MKTSAISFSFFLLVAGCSTPHPARVTVAPRPEPSLPDNLTERVRYPEWVKSYHVGRYLDPYHRFLLHEAHTIYRVEASATWNLHSPTGCFVLPSAIGLLTNVASRTPVLNDAVIAEVNRQRALTQAVTQQAQSLDRSLQEFTSALATNRALVEQNRLLRDELSRIERRLGAAETQLQQRRAAASEPQ